MSRSNCGAYMAPKIPVTMETATPHKMACTAATDAPSGSFSPMRRATVAVAAMARPRATLKSRTIRDSVRPTAAMESAPSLATQNASTRPKVASMAISRTVGIASSAMPRLRLPSVKSCLVPPRASFKKPHLVREPWELDCVAASI